jgi:hypothetical protein
MIIAFITNTSIDSIINANLINKSAILTVKKSHEKENIMKNSLKIITENSIHQDIMNIETKLKRREILLIELNAFENIIKKERSDEHDAVNHKKLRLQNLSEKNQKTIKARSAEQNSIVTRRRRERHHDQ